MEPLKGWAEGVEGEESNKERFCCNTSSVLTSKLTARTAFPLLSLGHSLLTAHQHGQEASGPLPSSRSGSRSEQGKQHKRSGKE